MSSGDFLYSLGSMIESQLNLGDGKTRTLDTVSPDGNFQRYGKLGDFAKKFDQSAERSYTEEGFFRHDINNPKAKNLEILMQEPDITVLIKKRAFSSLAENFRPDLMDKQEKLFLKATKILFQNKCNQIAAFEKLSKIAQLSSTLGYVDSSLLPIIIGVTDGIETYGGISTTNPAISKFKAVLDKVKRAIKFSERQTITNWTTNPSRIFQTEVGEGTGVIELTTVTSLTTSTTVETGGGRCTLRISDPYGLMTITNQDIEEAINSAISNVFYGNFLQVGIKSLDTVINDSKVNLNLIRASRGANPITFEVNSSSFLGRKVIAIIENSGEEIKFDFSASGNGFTGVLVGGQTTVDDSAKINVLLGNDGLTDQEVSIFSDIVASIYRKISLDDNSKSQAKSKNQETNKLRTRLRLHYANKLVIQPMDVLHIYIGSKSNFDNKLVAGLQQSFSQLGLMQALNSTVGDLRTLFNTDNSLGVEKAIFVGNDFPSSLWYVLRNQFINVKNGAHVFSGLVNEASQSYNGGSYSVSIGAKDNVSYFEHGIVNFKPSVDVFNGPLYDPLTPFNIEFDTLTGVPKNSKQQLLDENKSILQSRFVKSKSGANAGKALTQANYPSDYERTNNIQLSRIYYDPDGFVYRWKEGIGTLVLFGDNYATNPVNKPTPVRITEDPFAGQDIMNVLSLLISGQPYNFATFYKAARDFDSFGRDPITGEDPSVSFYKTLSLDFAKRNYLYGNFVPFKQLTMDENSYKNILNNQMNVANFDDQITALLQQRAALSDKIIFLEKANSTSNSITNLTDPSAKKLANDISNIDAQIRAKQDSILREIKTTHNSLKIAGDDVSFDYDAFLNNSKPNSSLNNPNIRKELRRKINFLTQRLLWKVKSNEDVNLLIIDDSYDKDFDIQAFEKTFTKNFKLFQSEYETVIQKIQQVANVLNLEVFANSQGHIQVRVPQYNKIPSSILYNMIRLKKEKGIQIYPQFLEDLFISQLDSIIANVEIIEDQIRLDCAYVGQVNDDEVLDFIRGSSDIGTAGDAQVVFLSKENTGTILSNNLTIMGIMAHPDKQNESIRTKLETNINNQNQVSNVFDIIKRSNTVISSFDITGKDKATDTGGAVLDISTDYTVKVDEPLANTQNSDVAIARINQLKNRLAAKSAQFFKVDSVGSKPLTGIEFFKITQDIADKIKQRQLLIKSAANALKNIEEAISINQNTQNVDNKALFPNLFGVKNIPEPLEHMIEDESYDDLGPNSGKRYIIKNSDIINYTVYEHIPEHTAVNVVGSFGDLFIPQSSLPNDLNVFDNGNALTTVSAVDYDLWRMYGVKIPNTVVANFITDPQTQGAAYAVSLLNRARRDILNANATLVGNEYMQAGEVYYLENRDLLFYATRVSHEFTYGQSFHTTVELKYGHNPGEYIPTPLDVMGKTFYKNKDITNSITYRQNNVYNQDHLGVIISNTNFVEAEQDYKDNLSNAITTGKFNDVSTTPPQPTTFNITEGTFGTQNVAIINNMIYNATNILNKGTTGFAPKVEIRIYFNSKDSTFSTANAGLKELATMLKGVLTGTTTLGKEGPLPITLKGNPDSDVIIKEVDTAKDDEFRYASTKAFEAARSIVSNNKTSGLNDATFDQTKKIDNIIYNMILDCWIVLG